MLERPALQAAEGGAWSSREDLNSWLSASEAALRGGKESAYKENEHSNGRGEIVQRYMWMAITKRVITLLQFAGIHVRINFDESLSEGDGLSLFSGSLKAFTLSSGAKLQ